MESARFFVCSAQPPACCVRLLTFFLPNLPFFPSQAIRPTYKRIFNTEVFMNIPSSDIHALLHEKFESLLPDCDQVLDKSAHGNTFDDLDPFLFTEGRKVLAEVLEQKMQERIKRTEATKEGKECPHCKKNDLPIPPPQNNSRFHRLRHPRTLLSSVPSLQKELFSYRRNLWNKNGLQHRLKTDGNTLLRTMVLSTSRRYVVRTLRHPLVASHSWRHRSNDFRRTRGEIGEPFGHPQGFSNGKGKGRI